MSKNNQKMSKNNQKTLANLDNDLNEKEIEPKVSSSIWDGDKLLIPLKHKPKNWFSPEQEEEVKKYFDELKKLHPDLNFSNFSSFEKNCTGYGSGHRRNPPNIDKFAYVDYDEKITSMSYENI